MPLILRGDARHLPLPDGSVDLIVTSPPYFGLRSYTDAGETYDGQIGAEPTPREYIAALIECTREWTRVLKPSGSIFVNLGDSYYSGKGAPGKTTTDPKNAGRNARRAGASPLDRSDLGFPRKSLLLLPERYRIACVDELGLIARAVIIWQKPNGLPSSVTDRVNRTHEDWVHLTKQPRYYSAVDESREPHAPAGLARRAYTYQAGHEGGTNGRSNGPLRTGGERPANPLGKLPGSVWEIATQPLNVPAELGVDHFAAFPMEWPRRLILGWSPQQVCTACGEGRRPVTTVDRVADRPGRVQGRAVDALLDGHGPDGRAGSRFARTSTITGHACACADTTAPSTPGVVLDPFGGTGTTALVATMLGRRGISVDLSADYCRLATWRVNDPKERARAAGLDPAAVAKVPIQATGQFDLFGEVTA
jgi:DNA modification methylase